MSNKGIKDKKVIALPVLLNKNKGIGGLTNESLTNINEQEFKVHMVDLDEPLM
jgi:hypothetical protein